MSAIGSQSCTFVRNDAPALKERVDVWQIGGYDGYGAQLFGKGESQCQFKALLFGTNAAVESWVVAIEAMQGSIQSITNDHGTTYSVLITKISPPKRTAAIIRGTAYDTLGELTVSGVRL